ncbi:MAG: CCA tRNA nucleotidyltransferase [Candidatus Nanoclepta minutus]|uniref:CCA-adding enzyme n=1 Tax=Candidatus Nanoclepta minutus TaxID=1940235 RepID=A0A397WMI9_9ARCH|nr:MAG: CCA tRNA nucleotidyltransferase [Candidatus Nanoclepta minutus]
MFEDILKKIKPSEEERKRVYEIIREIVERLEKRGLEVFLGGSFAKDTWISNNYDIDLFILFRDGEGISKKIEETLKEEKMDYAKVRGSRDYFKVFYRGMEFELVPALKIGKVEDAENVIDLSPFHVSYVRSKIEGTNLADEIRLLKVFMKNIGTYGAESYVRGFSGYATELLILYYKSFYNLILNTQDWRPKVFLDIEGYYNDIRKAINVMGKDKTKSPIIIVDPVYPVRNATSSVSVHKFAEFIYYSRILLEEMRNGLDVSKYFEIKKKVDISKYLEYAKRYGANLLYIEIEGKGGSKDIKNTKALKFFKRLVKELEVNNFPILRKFVIFDEKVIGIIYVYLDKLLEYRKKEGPLVWDKESFEKFLKKHRNEEVFVEEDGRVYAIINKKVKSEEILEDMRNKYSNSIEKFYFKLY